MDKIFASNKQKKVEASNRLFEEALKNWEQSTAMLKDKYEKEIEKYEGQLASWTKKKETFELEQKEKNDAIERKKELYLAGESESIIEYCDMVLSNSVYPDYFPQEFNIIITQ